MSNRGLMVGAPTVEVDLSRYDELLHKEAQLEAVLRLAASNTVLTTNYIWAICGTDKEESDDA